tara:strand:+ start:398 stop:2050 length:1653 start_codon:yes stop_codon:yes gene_type:complete
MAETDNFYSGEDESLYGVTGGSIVSAFSLAAQKEKIKIDQAKEDYLKEQKESAENQRNALLAGGILYKTAGAIDKRNLRTAESLAKDEDLVSVDDSSWKFWKSGKDRLKASSKFGKLSEEDRIEALKALKDRSPETFEAVSDSFSEVGITEKLEAPIEIEADLYSAQGEPINITASKDARPDQRADFLAKRKEEFETIPPEPEVNFEPSDPDIKWQAEEYKKNIVEGKTAKSAESTVKSKYDVLSKEADPDFNKVFGDDVADSPTAYENYTTGKDRALLANQTEDDFGFDAMINEAMGEDLPEAMLTEDDINLAKYKAETDLLKEADDAGYKSVEFYQKDLKQMKADGYDDLDLWHQDKIKEDEAWFDGMEDASESESIIVDEILQERDPDLNLPALDKGNVKINNPAQDVATDIVDDSDVSMFDTGAFDKGMNAVSTTSSILNLADTAGIIDMNDSTAKAVDAAGTVAQAAKTVNAVRSGSQLAATGMGKVMPAVGVVTGAMSAFDSDADTDDRIRGGMTAVGSAMLFTPLAPLGALLTVGSSLWSLFD